jgi:hypothetical protein
MVSVVAPTTIPRYSAFRGIRGAVLGHAVGVTKGAGILDRWHAQEAEACLMKRDVFGNLACEMHGALLDMNIMTTYKPSFFTDEACSI